jgi:hypothetical protein
MAFAALTALVVKAWLALTIVSLASLASAQDASITPQDDIPDFYEMSFSIQNPETGPYIEQYAIAPLTSQAGLNESNAAKVLYCLLTSLLCLLSNWTFLCHLPSSNRG